MFCQTKPGSAAATAQEAARKNKIFMDLWLRGQVYHPAQLSSFQDSEPKKHQKVTFAVPQEQDYRFTVEKLIKNEQFSQAVERKVRSKHSSIDSVFKMRSLGEPAESTVRRAKGVSCNNLLRLKDGGENSLADSNNAGDQSGGC